MSVSTLDYLARLALWALGLCLAEGVLVTGSWLLWARMLRRASARLRHRLAAAHSAGFTVLPALSLIALQGALVRAGTGDLALPGASLQATPASGVLAALMLVAAGVWLAGAMVCAIRLLDAWRETRRIERGEAPAELAEAVARLSGLLGLRRRPAVAIAEVAAPQVVGCRRPAVLLPADIDARLTSGELDAVLLHELVHVRCGDYGWNLLQRSLLVLTWFHPGAWFVHARLRCEREIRCDELAARRCRSRADLAMALVRLAEPWPAPSAGLALSAASGELALRVTRLIEPRRVERPWLAALPTAAAIGLCALAVAAGDVGRSDAGLRDLYLASAFGPARLIEARDPAGVFQLRILNGRVLAASVGPWAIPARIVQHGAKVMLIDGSGGPMVAVTVTPQGRIQWRPRPRTPQA